MASRKALIATGATSAVVGGFASLALGAWGPQPQPPKTVAEAPLVINDVQTIHKTVKVKAKARPVARPTQVASVSAPTAYAASNPPQRVSSTPAYSQRPAPTVSSHSSGGTSGGEGGYEAENNTPEREGQDD